VKVDWLARLRDRWDYQADPAEPVPFDRVVTQINIRRLEFAAIASLANQLGEIYLNLSDKMMADGWLAVACMPVLLGLIVLANRQRKGGNERLKKALPIAGAVFGLLSTQLAIGLLASDGRLTSGYPLTVLALTLMFVLPPRTLALILSLALVSYLAIVSQTPVVGWEKLVAAVNAVTATGVAIAAGWLIYDARRRDHVQRLLIHRQNTLLIARGREMDELMAITAHDLRSPLLGLRNLLSLAASRAATDPDLPLRVLAEGGRSLDDMLDLVRRLLEVHRAEHDPGEPPVRDDLRLHLAAAVDRVRPLAQAAQVEVVLDLAPRPVCAVFDPSALTQILDNLLANAVRFSPEGETVLACCRSGGGLAAILVEDRGAGVGEDERPFLFQKFRRGGAAPQHGPKGTGIGLFIVATLAERIGASARHRPASPRGSIFEVTLPVAD
jgi:signal transduction histidine kinase